MVLSITIEKVMNCMTLCRICVQCGSGYVPVSFTGELIMMVFIQLPEGDALRLIGETNGCLRSRQHQYL